MAKHTPGPWEQVADSIKSRRADCVVVRLPAQTDRVGDESPEQIDRWNADAHLIAAAPDLLAGLEQAIWMLYGIGVDPEKPAMESFTAAIRKAKGLE